MSRFCDSIRLAAAILAIAVSGAGWAQVDASRWDVVVVGSEPEAIAAAVTAAEEGARTALVTPDATLGGLFVRGALNVLDVRTEPFSYQRGIFERWWSRVGRGHAFDVDRAAAVFAEMIAHAGVDVVLGDAEPLLEPRDPGAPAGTDAASTRAPTLRGVRVGDAILLADQVIDGTADADLASAAGASYSVGFASIGYPERMADTLVFRIEGIDWKTLRRGIETRGRGYASIDDRVAWGSFGGIPAAYVPRDPSLRLRGLNLGRETDGSVWVNALLVYGIEPFDPVSRAAGIARAAAEAPHVVAYLRTRIPGFERAAFAGVADELYVRETRHLEAACTLTADDVLDNRVTSDAIAAGGYPLDVQSLTPNDTGFVFGVPEIYGVELCVTVPRDVDGLWVVGHSAGFDPIAHASARVVPLGMAIAEAAGIAAARAAQEDLTPRAFVADAARIGALRSRLTERGAYLPSLRTRPPVGPIDHPHYAAYRTLLARGLAVGGYENDPRLDQEVGSLGYIYLLANVGQRFLDRADLGRTLVGSHGSHDGPLLPDRAIEITASAGCALGRCPEAAEWGALARAGLVPENFRPGPEPLTRGEMYEIAAHIATAFAHGPVERAAPEDAGAGTP